MALNISKIIKKDIVSDPSSVHLWVVGSLKGDLDYLEYAVMEIESHPNFCSNDKIIFMGDILGKGLNNRRVLEKLKEYQETRPNQIHILRGSSEHQFIMTRVSFFISKVGKSLISNYTMLSQILRSETINIKDLIRMRDWFKTFPSIIETNNYFFVNGGIVSTKSLKEQNPHAVMFVHDVTDKDKLTYDKVIVHSTKENEFNKNCIGVNSGVILLNDTKKNVNPIEIKT